MDEAATVQRDRAAGRGPEAVRRVELLQLRFAENLPIHTIAARRGVDPAPPPAAARWRGGTAPRGGPIPRLSAGTGAGAIMDEAATAQRAGAAGRGPEAVGGVELLNLRFAETLPIHTIAARRGVDPARL